MNLTPVQEAYLIGRKKRKNLGGTACHVYLEFDGSDISYEKLRNAWREVCAGCPSMQMQFLDDGTANPIEKPFSDKVLYLDYSGKTPEFVQKELMKLRHSFSHRMMHTEAGQTAGLFLVHLPEQKCRLIFDLDLLMCDVYGFQVILDRLAQAYHAQTAQYPALPFLQNPAQMYACHYQAFTAEIDERSFLKMQRTLSEFGLDCFEAILTMFGKAIAELSSENRFILNVPMFDIEHRKGIVADKTQLLFVPQFRNAGSALIADIQDTADCISGLLDGSIPNTKPSADRPAVVFSYTRGKKLISPMFENLFGNVSYMISQTPEVAIDCQIFETNHGLRIDWMFPETLFDTEQLNICFDHFISSVRSITEVIMHEYK